MLNDIDKKSKIDKFLKDGRMAEAVYQVLIESFMKVSPLDKDIQYLAASRIAINLLQEGWKDLEKYREKEQRGINSNVQVGL